MKTTYLLNKQQPDGGIALAIASHEEWLSVIKADKRLPPEQRRCFVFDYIADGDSLDCMVIETPYEEFRVWDRERKAEARNRNIGRRFQQLSLDAPPVGSDSTEPLLSIIDSGEEVEPAVYDKLLADELRAALAAWRPWANDLLELYLCGQKRACTSTLAKKYGVSLQAVRKYKRQFEKFIKNFWKVFRFNPHFVQLEK